MYLYPDYFVLHVSDYLMVDRLITLIVVEILMFVAAVIPEGFMALKIEAYQKKGIEPIMTPKSSRACIVKLYCLAVLGSFDILLILAQVFTLPISIFRWHFIFSLFAVLALVLSYLEFSDWLNAKNELCLKTLSNDQENILKRYTHIKAVTVLNRNLTKIPIFLLLYDYLTDFPKLQHFIFN
ncbi:hypothetical protein RA086_10760 [Lactiplantibacillus sp. WILCCON 0030]|uniref:Integral membrane protein n=1 Tax=Lactiplantibacillus brownii TaxID=3069269 RepID=A0ABU1ACP8_9LACO|nr:hypothetical protein [Lactiplantibacillus brownii]MDQ7938090.1 hypothetical protein [Lactiplantibacillus brownii]